MQFRNIMAGLVGTLLLAGAVAIAPAEAGKKLTYGSYLPAPHLAHKSGLEPFFKRVEAETKGELTFELFPGGAMGGGKAMLSIVRDGIVDSSIIIDAYIKRDIPVSAAITEMAILGDNAMAMAGAANEMHLLDCPQCEAELKGNKVKPLAYYSTSSYMLMCTKPVESLADVKGLKIRATSAFGVWASAMGGTPVSITSSEIYEGMQRGQLDCTLGSPAWLKSYNLKDVVKSIVNLPMGSYFGALIYDMNAKTWKGLPMAQKKAIVKHLPKLVSDIVTKYKSDSDTAIANAAAAGVKLTAADPALLKLIAEHRKGEFARVSKKAAKAGIKNPEALLTTFFAKVDKWNKIVKSINGDPVKYQQALWDEVFSKLKY